ncbi:DinB family protein [Thermostaphylospora chromogena]|uniref:DinB superfamily protein n=1 Tax=Thermostaphylospora chromogena TaxID=35622 RepID=A0A1H1HPQ1_9ACTN|nr:DinB family protein [Thermostaphylospora chromogena]SDR27414.1 Protein of unknown function [Thermostaphylospora chromogena]
MEPPSEPPQTLADPRELLLGYLDYYRAVVVRKLDGLSERELRTSRLPSGWTPLELLKHLAYMERRWLRWGFMGERVEDPWGDQGPDGRWRVGEEETLDDLKALLAEQAEATRRIVTAARLDDSAATGGRFAPPAPVPTLGWILCHVLQEYARHAGHIDVVRELTDGTVGK